ncbi:MAG: autotransporter-associated beta strand repeat-containing protein, partial [Chthoniobacterales bacterium]
TPSQAQNVSYDNIRLNHATSGGLTIDVAAGESYTYSGTIGSSNPSLAAFSVTKSGAGTQVLAGSNNYTGRTTVSGGVLELNSSSGSSLGASTSVTVAAAATLLIAQSNQVNDAAAVTLSGGTITRASGVSEALGALNLTADSTLNFGSGTGGTLTFGVYEGGLTPDFKLNVTNFFLGNTLVFGSNIGAFIASSSAGPYSGTYFAFDQGFTTTAWNGSSFTITAIPEPSTVVVSLGLTCFMLWSARRRWSRSPGAPSAG